MSHTLVDWIAFGVLFSWRITELKNPISSLCDASSFGGKVLKVVSFTLFNAISIYCNERVSEWKEWFQRLFCKRKNAKNVFSLRTLHLIPNLPFSLAHLEFLCHACALIFTRDTVFKTFSQQGDVPNRKWNPYPLVSLHVPLCLNVLLHPYFNNWRIFCVGVHWAI